MNRRVCTKSKHITKSGSNIFSDLGFNPIEAEKLLVKSNEQILRLKNNKN